MGGRRNGCQRYFFPIMTVNTGGHSAQPVLTFHMDIGDRRLRFFDFMSHKLEQEVAACLTLPTEPDWRQLACTKSGRYGKMKTEQCQKKGWLYETI